MTEPESDHPLPPQEPAVEQPPETAAGVSSPSKPRAWPVEIVLALTFAGLLALGLAGFVMPGPLEHKTTLLIPHGAGIHEIAALLDKNGIVISPLPFRLAVKILAADNLQAGEYEFTPKQNIAEIVMMLREGHSVVHLFTVAEGLTSADISHLLQYSPALTGTITAPPPEGSLLPETYRYSYGDSRSGMIARMQKSMQDTINELWARRDLDVLLKTPREAVVMASVVEKETGKAAERPRIAGVFYNRLRAGMRLQSDPTVIYAITQAKGAMDRNLDRNDLAFPSPINTYVSDGLPPQPICNPGRAALEAVLHPEHNDFLYFVADGSGGHVFAKDLAAHNQNVAHYRGQQAVEGKGQKP